MDMVSAIIPTFNRFKYLLNTIKSIKEQTYENIEIIVVNDCSTEKEYYEHDWNGVNIIHLKVSSRVEIGFPCASHVRNQGINQSKGKYIAFCDDDDIWFPGKIELQINAMKNSGCQMSSTEGFIGHGEYDKTKEYELYLVDHMIIFNGLVDNDYPDIWTLQFLSIFNNMLCSSVVLEKEILDKINNFTIMPPPGEDYDCWLKALEHTDSVYVDTPLVYYDNLHGHGIQWQ